MAESLFDNKNELSMIFWDFFGDFWNTLSIIVVYSDFCTKRKLANACFFV